MSLELLPFPEVLSILFKPSRRISSVFWESDVDDREFESVEGSFLVPEILQKFFPDRPVETLDVFTDGVDLTGLIAEEGLTREASGEMGDTKSGETGGSPALSRIP